MGVPLVDEATIETASATHAGMIRSLNEDSIAIVDSNLYGKKERGTMLVLADGLGGYNAGEIASALMTTKLPELYFHGSSNDLAFDLLNAIRKSNTMIHEASVTTDELSGMGTTVVAVVIVEQYAIFAHVGDSRGYLLRNGSIFHRTKDHSLRDASLDIPGFRLTNRFSHVLTRAIGTKPDVLVDLTAHRILPGDTLLLCSDGLTDCVDDEEIRDIVFRFSPAEAVQVLVDTANARGGADNISVIIAKLNDVPSQPG